MELNKLVILDKNEFNPKQREELKKLAKEFAVFEDLPKDDAEAIKRIGNADAVIVNWYSINKKILDACPSIKYLGVVATGYDWLDVNSAIQKGITVTNVPGYATEAVSSFIFKQLEGFDTQNKTLGIIGLGNIGSRVAELGKSRGLNVIYWSRTPKKSVFQAAKSIEEIFKKANLIALLVKLNSGTEKIIKNKHLDSLKENSIIVDVVSPKLFEDTGHLIQAVNSKGIKLILDFEADNKLSELAKTNKNIVYTPNIAWRSEKSIFNLHQIALDNLKSFVAGKTQNQVK